jgi:hypothetical protein
VTGASPPATRELADQVLVGARDGIAKLAQGAPSLSVRELAGVEAVILVDGTRPSLTVHDGFIDLDDPKIGDWKAALDHFHDAIRSVTASVGRLDSGGQAIGTAFAIAPDLVLTNRHVLEEIAIQQAAGWTLNRPENTTVEFIGEQGSDRTRRARIVEVAFAPPLPIERQVRLERPDFAVLRLIAGDGDVLPPPLQPASDPDLLFDGRDLYVVGFPGRPLSFFGEGPPPPQHETNEVLKEVFDFKFGVKKLAPGQADKIPGELAGDINNWAFSHDASTLGGNSGSCILDLTEDAKRVVGLHFAGVSRELNFAHSLAALRPQLEPLGVEYLE